MSHETEKRQGKQLLLRFPESSDLRDRLSAMADKNNRSLSAEIINRLESSFRDGRHESVLAHQTQEERIAALETAVLSMLVQISELNDRMDQKG